MIGAEQGGHRHYEYCIDVEVVLAALYCRQPALGGVIVPAAAAREVGGVVSRRVLPREVGGVVGRRVLPREVEHTAETR
jgi:hypothetical protein